MPNRVTVQQKVECATQSLNLEATPEEMKVIGKIVNRAEQLDRDINTEYNRTRTYMDILATHLNGCPLDLHRLLSYDDSTFAHDIWGIRMHINRRTGKLDSCFVPNCRKK